MKTLYLVRHAKSSWEFDLTDHERPLNDRGLRDAPRVAEYTAEQLPKPDAIWSSDAMRAKLTSFFFAKAYGFDENTVQLYHELYDFSGGQVVEHIRSCDQVIDRLMVFGHNNAMTNIVNTYGNQYTDNVPTCGVTALTFAIDDWRNLKPGKTIFSCTPKGLK